jgi:DNA polymerase-4
VARTIREQIRTELHLTASAGVAPNKFLAKIASDWKKPDGLFVIQPEDVDLFLLSLPVDRLPGVGKVTQEKLKIFEVHTIAHLRRLDLPTLESRFGRFGVRLYELARGVDESKVVPGRPTQSISVEDTFERDVPLTETEPMIRKLAELTWAASRKENRTACTVVLKLKTAEFKILTRSHTPSSPPHRLASRRLPSAQLLNSLLPFSCNRGSLVPQTQAREPNPSTGERNEIKTNQGNHR